ncbi:MAG: amino acid adenylation domain-containing protein [Clostridia bacterium]|nr:amino acid adenylation domain-containing protein [Clostridia bacterium]
MHKTNILEYLEESALIRGGKTALIGGECSLSFADLKSRAEAIGCALLQNGFYRKAVAVLMDKHPDTVCAFLGVLYAGCFYICIEPDEPEQRILSIIDRARVEAVICNEKSRDKARILRGRAEIIELEEALSATVDKNALQCVRERAIDTDPAYIVFTSGSTGEPKGVCASHRSVIDYAEAICKTLGFDESTVFGNQAPLYYDAPLKELLPCLMLGATVHFIPRELFLFPVRLCEYIRDKGINTLCFAASALANISILGALDVVSLAHLRTVCFGSEIFPRKEFDKWRSACPDTTFINLYGPTEATGMSTYWIADRELDADESIPIGKPFPNTEILIIVGKGKQSDEGEIYIRGSCVTNGYFNSPVETEAGFVQNPLNSFYPETVYRTGDMGRINSRGELVYLGRCDGQIKHMGRRIELGEIERAAERLDGISLARCVYDTERMRIGIGYIGTVEEPELLHGLAGLLPRYMLPTVCKRLECLPLLHNGKCDRRAIKNLIFQKESIWNG